MNKDDMGFLIFMEQFRLWQQQPKAYILNPDRVRHLRKLVDELNEILKEEIIDADVKITPCPLGTGDVIVKIETYSIPITGIAKFVDLVKQFDNFEIYPVGQEKICFAGVFSKVANTSLINDSECDYEI